MLKTLNLQFLAETTTWHRSLRLETLIRLRWFAVLGQSAAIIAVYWGLNSDLPVDLCLLAVAASAWLNIALRLRYPANHRSPGISSSWRCCFISPAASKTPSPSCSSRRF